MSDFFNRPTRRAVHFFITLCAEQRNYSAMRIQISLKMCFVSIGLIASITCFSSNYLRKSRYFSNLAANSNFKVVYKYSIYDAFTCQGPQTCIIECTRKEGKSYDFQALEDLNELIRNFSPDNLVITGDCFDTQSLRKILYAGVRKKVVLDSFVRSNANAVRQICDKSKLVICHNMLIDKLNTFCPWYATYKTQDILSTNGLDQKYFCNILTSLNNNRDQLGPLLGFNDQWCSYIFNYDIDSIESVCFEQLKNDSFSISQRTIDILAKLPKIQAVVIKSNTLTEHDLQIPYGWIYLKAGQF